MSLASVTMPGKYQIRIAAVEGNQHAERRLDYSIAAP
jgi:hypothetical protein